MKGIFVIGVVLCYSSMLGCKKYLDAKPSNDITIPSTVSDCQKLLDNSIVMNRWMFLDGESSGDNIWLSQSQYDSWGSNYITHLYWWGDDIYFSMETSNLWVNAYAAVEVANVILETLPSVERSDGDQGSFDNVKGSALFYRAYCFEKLLALYAKGYNAATKDNDLGIPLRLTADFNVPSVRSSVGDSYDQVVRDLVAAAPLLPNVPLVPQRPSKQAVFGALSETYLLMHDYENSKRYADSCLEISSDLLDYNDFSASSLTPFSNLTINKEVVFLAGANGSLGALSNYYNIDSVLYGAYTDGDLRKGLFFKPNRDGVTFAFKGRYFPNFSYFCGIALDEIYLNRAESNARIGDVAAAIADLNHLLEKRYETGSFVPYNVVDAKAALTLILDERRKELVFREFRWSDIKRFNVEGAGISITHFINSQTYTLSPNDNRFAVALPYRDVKLSGMKQNPR